MTNEESLTTKIMKVFPNEKISLQRDVLGKKIDLYFTEYRLAIETDEKGNNDRPKAKEAERENKRISRL